MRKRILIVGSVAILACLAFAAAVMLGWIDVWPGGPRLRLTGGGGTSVGNTSVQYVISDRGIALAVWWTDVGGPSGSGSESGLFRTTARGFFSAPDGKKINWEWHAPREKGGDFQIDGTSHDLANGTLFLVSTKDGQLRVTQLDVDLSQVQPNQQGFEALAKKQPKIAKFIAAASGPK
jgi:hypothetical protein